MKAYLVSTGTVFGLIAVLHLARGIAERKLVATDPWAFWGMAALGALAAALSLWAWVLLWKQLRTSRTSEPGTERI